MTTEEQPSTISRQQRRAQERQSAKELDIQNRFLSLKAQNDRLTRQRLEKIKADRLKGESEGESANL